MRGVPPVEDVLSLVTLFAGRSVTHRRLPGGLSHQIWQVEADGRQYVLRLLNPAISAAGLGVAPALEINNTLRAAESGAGARVFEVLPEVPALVLEYLPGRTLHAPDIREPENLPRLALACRRLHAGPRFGNEFSIVAKLHELVATCRRHDLRLPDGYLDRLPVVREIAAALERAPVPTVPCHNDLLAENFIDSGADIRIVDYQLAGNNDPCFELGDIAAEADFDAERTEALTRAYFNADYTPALAARVRLHLILSNLAWTLWFCVHHGLVHTGTGEESAAGDQSGPAAEPAEFDYWAEASDKCAQAMRDLDAPDFARLLHQASQRPTLRSPATSDLP